MKEKQGVTRGESRAGVHLGGAAAPSAEEVEGKLVPPILQCFAGAVVAAAINDDDLSVRKSFADVTNELADDGSFVQNRDDNRQPQGLFLTCCRAATASGSASGKLTNVAVAAIRHQRQKARCLVH